MMCAMRRLIAQWLNVLQSVLDLSIVLGSTIYIIISLYPTPGQKDKAVNEKVGRNGRAIVCLV